MEAYVVMGRTMPEHVFLDEEEAMKFVIRHNYELWKTVAQAHPEGWNYDRHAKDWIYLHRNDIERLFALPYTGDKLLNLDEEDFSCSQLRAIEQYLCTSLCGLQQNEGDPSPVHPYTVPLHK